MSFPNLIQSEVIDYPHLDVLAVKRAHPFRDSSFHALLNPAVQEYVDQSFACVTAIQRTPKPLGRWYCGALCLRREQSCSHRHSGMSRLGIGRPLGDQIDFDDPPVPACGHPAPWIRLHARRNRRPCAFRYDLHQPRVADHPDLNPAAWTREKLETEPGQPTCGRIAANTLLATTGRPA